MKRAFLLLSIAAMAIACEDESNSGVIRKDYFESYIPWFCDPDDSNSFAICYDFNIDTKYDIVNYNYYEASIADIPVIDLDGGICLNLHFNSHTNYFPNKSNSEATTKYRYYTGLIGDTHYNQTVWTEAYYSKSPALTAEAESIKITCDKNWDNTHPAGSDLSDLFVMYYEDYYTIVQNDYVESEDMYRFPPGYYKNAVESPGPDFSAIGSPFIGSNWIFHLISAPANTDNYSFTITVSFANGVTTSTTTGYPAMIAGQDGN
jgi:hypothetical protein